MQQDDDNVFSGMMKQHLKEKGKFEDAQELMLSEHKKKLFLFGVFLINVILPAVLVLGLYQHYGMMFLCFLMYGGFIVMYKGYLLKSKNLYVDKVFGGSIKDPKFRGYLIGMICCGGIPLLITLCYGMPILWRILFG